MDQLVDMAIYEQAVREGQLVVMVKARGQRKAAAIRVLREHGGHFMNYYGRFATEEVERWHGPEPKVPGLLRR
jgi:rhodanese-related sulfurtransferase